jgi:hypothetical protein
MKTLIIICAFVSFGLTSPNQDAVKTTHIHNTECTHNDSHPCHPLGDLGPCGHAVHAFDIDIFGNKYPCSHRIHKGDLYPCVHVCY